jgi:hypothetical protein
MRTTAERLAYLLYKLESLPNGDAPTEADCQRMWIDEQHKDEWLGKAVRLLEWTDCAMTEQQEHQAALNALAEAGLGSDNPADAFIAGYKAGYKAGCQTI